MAAESFDRPLIIDSDERAKALFEAYKAACDQKPIEKVDYRRRIERGVASLEKKCSH